MAGDVNSWAMQVEFALKDLASAQLNTIGTNIGDLERQLSEVAAKAVSDIANVTTQVNTVLKQISLNYTDINASTVANLEPLGETNDLNKVGHEALIAESKLLRDNFLGAWVEIIETLEHKAVLLDEEHKLLVAEEHQARAVGGQMSEWDRHVRASNRSLEGMLRNTTNIRGIITEAATAAEMFKNANFRLYGSQTQLIGVGNRLALQYGVMRSEALEAVSALGNLKVPRESLEQLVGTITKFNRLSGVSISQSASYAKMLTSMGASATEVTRQTEYLANSMRSFGLDVNDVTSLMRASNAQPRV